MCHIRISTFIQQCQKKKNTTGNWQHSETELHDEEKWMTNNKWKMLNPLEMKIVC